MIPCTDLMMFMLCGVGRRVWVARSASGGGTQALSGSTQSADATDTRTTPAHRHPAPRGRPHARGRADWPVHGGGTVPVHIICCRVKRLDSCLEKNFVGQEIKSAKLVKTRQKTYFTYTFVKLLILSVDEGTRIKPDNTAVTIWAYCEIHGDVGVSRIR